MKRSDMARRRPIVRQSCRRGKLGSNTNVSAFKRVQKTEHTVQVIMSFMLPIVFYSFDAKSRLLLKPLREPEHGYVARCKPHVQKIAPARSLELGAPAAATIQDVLIYYHSRQTHYY